MLTQEEKNNRNRFHIYQAGIYFKKFTTDEKQGSSSIFKNWVHNVGSSYKYSYQVLQFFFETSNPHISELAMVYSMWAGNDLEELSGHNSSPLKHSSLKEGFKRNGLYVDSFEIGGLNNVIRYKNEEIDIIIISENLGLVLDVGITRKGKSDISGKFRFLSSDKFFRYPYLSIG
jgi:hypothetical protein